MKTNSKNYLNSFKKTYTFLTTMLLGMLLLCIILFYFYMHSMPTLSLWHTTLLKNEFTENSNVHTFKEYIDLEKKLFDELEEKIYNKVPTNEQNSINRYARNSISSPQKWKINWNKSFELPIKNPKAGIVLIHGLSDSPYSLHSQAIYLHKHGYWVIGLRMPGHGTIPSGLRLVKWQDMAKVVKIGMKHIAKKVRNKPLIMMGYSTGATLALHYTLEALHKESKLPLPKKLIFYSPAIGVSKAAPLAVWQSRIGKLLSLPRLEWNSIELEFDPFKYNSFAVNAAQQVYLLSKKVQQQFDHLHETSVHKTFPTVLSFSSIVDNTVSTSDTIHKLYNRLPKGKHNLVLFDIQHHFTHNNLIKKNIVNDTEKIRNIPLNSNYTFTLISDINSTDNYPQEFKNHKLGKILSSPWPKDIYSLSHLSLPIAPNDKVYGDNINLPTSRTIIQLGRLAIYGERSVFEISPALLLRQRWNPFHAYIKKKVLEFLQNKL